MKKYAVTGIVFFAAVAAAVGLAPAAQAQPPGYFVGYYSSEAACVTAGDFGVAHGEWAYYACTLWGVQAPRRSLWAENS
ncbi:MAG: hypothetical protein ABIP57_08325 [Jatrophihabitantaceae bacterium]